MSPANDLAKPYNAEYYRKENQEELHPAYFDEIQLIVSKLEAPILDLGCGTGRLALVSKKEIYGLDISEHAIKRATERGMNALVGNALKLPFREGSFRSIVLNQVLDHLEEPEKCLWECYRVLKRGGKLLINIDSKAVPEHKRLFSPKELEGLLNNCGFKPSSLPRWIGGRLNFFCVALVKK